MARNASKTSFGLTAGYFAVIRSDAEPLVSPLPVRVSEPRRRLGSNGTPAVAFARDGRSLFGASSRTLTEWDGAGEAHSTPLLARRGENGHVAFSDDRSTLALCAADSSIRIWDVALRQEIVRLEGDGDRKAFSTIAIAPDGSWVAAVDPHRPDILRRWNARTGQEWPALQADVRSINCLAASPDGRTIAAGTTGLRGARIHQVLRWDVATWLPLAALTGHDRGVRTIAFSPDGRTLASGGDDGIIQRWDVEAGRSVRLIQGLERQLVSLAFSPDGALLAAGTSDGQAWLYDAATGDARACIEVGRRWVWCVSFSPDGRHLATTGFGVPVSVWDLRPIDQSSTPSLRAVKAPRNGASRV